MKVRNIVSTEFEEYSADTTASKLVGVFEDPDIDGVVITRDGAYQGIVTRRQLTTSHHPPEQKATSLLWHVPKVSPNEDVRDVAQLMVDSKARLLPAFEGETLVGVVTADDLLRAVQSFLDAATVEDVYTSDLVTVDPDTSFGEALHIFQENRFTHLPVTDDDTAIGILSLYDVTPTTTRAAEKSQGGDPPDFQGGGGHSGGFGSREGESERVLDLPIRDVMVSPVHTVDPDTTLDDVVATMFENDCSSLVVTESDTPSGIVTKTDILDVLTWETDGSRAVQIFGMDLLTDMTYADVVDVVDGLDGRDGGLSILDAKIHLHEHDEKQRGVPLILARIRLHTDQGLFIGSGEGYGAGDAIREGRDVLERQIRDEKTRGKSKKHPDEAFWEKRFGWWLEE